MGLSPRDASGGDVKLASRLHLVSRLRISRRTASLTMYLHGVVQLSTDHSPPVSTERYEW